MKSKINESFTCECFPVFTLHQITAIKSILMQCEGVHTRQEGRWGNSNVQLFNLNGRDQWRELDVVDRVIIKCILNVHRTVVSITGTGLW
jgi:hypothetical protein